jgi:exonuclease III
MQDKLIRGGGVGIYVKNNLTFSINTNSIFLEKVFESVLVDVWANGKHFTVGSIYRCISKHPSLSPREQFTEFINLLQNLTDNLSNSELILGGDFNIDVVNDMKAS